MGHTKESAKKAVQTIYERYGKDHYHKIGLLGGSPIIAAWKTEQLKLGKEKK